MLNPRVFSSEISYDFPSLKVKDRDSVFSCVIDKEEAAIIGKRGMERRPKGGGVLSKETEDGESMDELFL